MPTPQRAEYQSRGHATTVPSIGYGAELCASPRSDLRRTLALESALLWARTGAPMLDTVQWLLAGNALQVSSCSRANSTPWASFAANAGCDPSVPSVKAGSCISSWTFDAHPPLFGQWECVHGSIHAPLPGCCRTSPSGPRLINERFYNRWHKTTHQHQSHALRTPLQHDGSGILLVAFNVAVKSYCSGLNFN